MSKITFALLAFLSLVVLVMGALTVFTLAATPAPRPDLTATAVAEAVSRTLTQIAQINPTATALPPTPTHLPPTPTATIPPVVTALPTQRPLPAPTSQPCNQAQFVSDISIPDGTRLTRNVPFTKTWRLKNTGACTWTREYALVWVGGDGMAAPAAVTLPRDVLPGESIDLSVAMKAPDKPGDQRAEWMLRDESGRRFGLGAGGSQPFWVWIIVREPTRVVYDFADRLCKADWRLDRTPLACQGRNGDASGTLSRVDEPRLEGGRLENEPGLVITAPDGTSSLILGRYPAFDVQAGDRFRTIIGCLDGSDDCQATFRLRYRVGGGPVVTLAEWEEKYDGKWTSIDLDLSPLAGQPVQFILSVRAHRGGEQARAFWLAPHILR